MLTHEHGHSPKLSYSRGGGQVRLIFISTVMAMSFAFMLFAVNTWHETQSSLSRELSYVKRLFRQTTETVLSHQESMLRVLGRRLEEAGAMSEPERGRQLIEQMLDINTAMAGFGLLRKDGQLLLVSSIEPDRPLPSLMDEEVSRVSLLEALESHRMVVGRTYYFPLLEYWLIPVRLALRDEDQQVSLAMTAGIDIDAEAAMWNAIELKPGMRLTLMRDDGYVQLALSKENQSREAIYSNPVEGFSAIPVGGEVRDPWLPDALSKSVRLERFPLTVIASYDSRQMIKGFIQRMSVPTFLFGVALIFGWLIFNYLLRNQKLYEDELIHHATHDALTRLPNRVLLEDRIRQDIERARHFKRHVAVMYIDLDQFKRINDTLGHKAGDRLLSMCADRLRMSLRQGDTVGRLGGDEFLVILPDLTEPNDAHGLASRILDDFNRPFEVEGRELFSTVSIGVAMFPNDGSETETLLKNADTALYRAKDAGRNSFCFFEPCHNTATARRIEVESALRSALAHDELRVVYQPKCNGKTLVWEGAEALLRWEHPKLGSVSPLEFIPIAEETGMIDAIGWFVLQRALHDLRLIREQVESFNMAVNVSVRQFRSIDFIPRLLGQLQLSEVPLHLLELEVTESIMAESVPQLGVLRDAGLRLAIDDFGTGFSSLSYLKRLPVTTLKIDREFIRDLETDSADRALVTAMLAVARELDLDTVAEGVETDGQRRFLQYHGCSQLQGYLVGRPMSIDVLLDQLQTHRDAATG